MIVSNAAAQGSRPYQEDYHAFYQPPPGLEARGSLFLLADGMGGMAAGSTASLMAVQYFREHYYVVEEETPSEASIPELLGKLLAGANQELVHAGVKTPSLRGMGTTLIACVIADDRLYFASIGDSHLYLCRQGEIRLLNEDHSVGGQLAAMLAQGKMTLDESRQYEGQAHKLVHYLGNRHFSHFDLSEAPVLLAPGDRIVMCSDGLYGTLADADIAGIAQATAPDMAADALIKAALQQNLPGQDNLTVQVITFKDTKRLNRSDTLSVVVPPIRFLTRYRQIALGVALAALAIVALFWAKPWTPLVVDGKNTEPVVRSGQPLPQSGPPSPSGVTTVQQGQEVPASGQPAPGGENGLPDPKADLPGRDWQNVNPGPSPDVTFSKSATHEADARPPLTKPDRSKSRRQSGGPPATLVKELGRQPVQGEGSDTRVSGPRPNGAH